MGAAEDMLDVVFELLSADGTEEVVRARLRLLNHVRMLLLWRLLLVKVL